MGKYGFLQGLVCMQNFLGTVLNGLLCLAVVYGIHYFLQHPFKSVVGISTECRSAIDAERKKAKAARRG